MNMNMIKVAESLGRVIFEGVLYTAAVTAAAVVATRVAEKMMGDEQGRSTGQSAAPVNINVTVTQNGSMTSSRATGETDEVRYEDSAVADDGEPELDAV